MTEPKQQTNLTSLLGGAGKGLNYLFRFFVPRTCPLCHRELLEEEEWMCVVCMGELMNQQSCDDEKGIGDHLFDRIPYEHAANLYNYRRQTPSSSLIKRAKYGNRMYINEQLAELFANELACVGWPFDIDVIVPIPIHWRRRWTRTYNQVEPIAQGLSKVWNLPVEYDCLYKHKHTPSQLTRSYEERLSAADGVFSIRHPERLRGKHVLLVDDVVTSGGTMTSGASTLLTIEGLRLSILALAFTQ